jgi:hypothetical protein
MRGLVCEVYKGKKTTVVKVAPCPCLGNVANRPWVAWSGWLGFLLEPWFANCSLQGVQATCMSHHIIWVQSDRLSRGIETGWWGSPVVLRMRITGDRRTTGRKYLLL